MNTRVIARLSALLPLVVGAVSFAGVQPAAAALVCTSDAYVHVRPATGPPIIRWETEPINVSPASIVVDLPNDGVTRATFFAVGGGGLKVGSTPTWDVYNGAGTFVGRVGGNKVGGDCLSSDKTFPIYASAGGVGVLKANYVAGNSGRGVVGQNHVVIYFV